MRLEGQKAIVTGAGAGIGAAILRAFVDEGARVVAVDMNLNAAQSIVDEVKAKGCEAYAIECNVSRSASVEAMVNRAVELLGGIDTLVNNAGIGSPGKLLDTTEEDWDRMMNVNVKGTFLVSKHALPHLLASGRGCIINMGSVAGLVGIRDRTAYCTS